MAIAPAGGYHASNNAPNGVNGHHHVRKPKYDPTFTDKVIAATGPNADPRLAQIMPSLIRHLHNFAREVDLTVAEWTTGVELINACGQFSTDKRNETQLLCDILGLESLVDEITSAQLASASSSSSGGAHMTPSAILGPFYRDAAPPTPYGGSIVRDLTPATPWYEQAVADSAFLTGRVLSAATGEPVAGATIDLWHSAPNGLYEQQDDGQADMNLRGRTATDARGRYAVYALRPAPYPIPSDGPAGALLRRLDRAPMRPAHIHFIVDAPGFRPLTTQVFDSRDRFISADAVFAVKEELVVHFVPREGDDRARWTLEYDFVLAEVDG